MISSGNAASKHLRQLEIDRLLGGERQGLETALSHLEKCEACQSRFEGQQQEQQDYVEPRAQIESERLLFLAAQRVQTTRLQRRRLSALVSLAAAAMVAFVTTMIFARREPLPQYTFSISHGSQILRDGNAAEPAVPRFTPHSRLRIDLRPAKAVKGPVTTQVWAEQGDRLQQLPLSVKASRDGALRLEGVFGEDFTLPLGRHNLWVFIFQEDNPDDEATIRGAIQNGSLPDGTGLLLKTEVIFDEKNEDQAHSRSPR